MPILPNYRAFAGRHYETGSIHNALAYQGVKAPHTGQPLSEALLLGVSGGITVGYFLFAYEGYDPHVALLTRNTFGPMETIFERLAIPRDVQQTSSAETGVKNLLDTLDDGHPALVWADLFMLPYNALSFKDEKMWAMIPVLVYGVEGDTVYIADRSSQPLRVSADTFTSARARVKQDKFRVMVLEHPDLDKLPAAVQKGIWQCISLYTEAPPKGTRENFGLAALHHWADMLTNTRNKKSWARFFPRGGALFHALAGGSYQPGLIGWVMTWGAGEGAERGLYADFLDEAALILNKPDLNAAAQQFRASAGVWCELANAALPDDVPLFQEARELKLKKHRLFVEQGSAALDEIHAIHQRLGEIKAQVSQDFPMSEKEVIAFRERLRGIVLRIHGVEAQAIEMLQAAME